mmetsp:Transcript_13327/g.25287  ORF Transcript_13327/g.25287 Transcript_13327/m.25287 type:complete len:869 (+) Transcript_13327:352-2958(+)|eukprot:scaffold2767_cov177-Amphora_coffeaeformis.AAC.80
MPTTVDDLSQTSRSFEDGAPEPVRLNVRARANTAPAYVHDAAQQQEDEEVREAKAIAMAISSNPNLSVDEARKVGRHKFLISSRIHKAAQKTGDGMERMTKTLKKSFRFDRAHHHKGTPGEAGSDHSKPFRHRQLTPRSPPMSPSVLIGEGSQSHDIEGEDGNMIRESSQLPPGTPSLPVYNNLSAPSPGMNSPRIRLTGLAWKRRGGMGKYSTTGAWERRRIELRGPKLMYYKKDSDEGDDDDNSHSPATTTNNALTSTTDDASEGVVVAKRSTWFEQVITSATSSGEADLANPRGEIHLIKEKAIVAATLGHTGAPSPFAISIKCRGETKWKLCFDRHKDQMEWLAALTDVTVQASVDAYNALLIEVADPSYIPDPVFPSTVSAPPGTQHRLWEIEPYTISTERAVSDGSLEYAIGPSEIVEELEAEEMKGEHVSADGTIAVDPGVAMSTSSSRTGAWVVPQQHFWIVAGVVNAALAVARASATSMERFWYVVALANLGLYLSTAHEFVTETVRTVPAAAPNKVTASGLPKKPSSPRKAPKSSTATNATMEKGKRAAFIPVAGTTSVRLKNPTDPPANAKGQLFAGWRCPSAEIMQVRGMGYSTLKKKQPSPGELYDCAQVEVFESPHRYPDMAPRVQLPKVEFKDEGPKTWRTPDVFVVSIALPTDPPKLGRSSSDGGGYTVTMYFIMRKETRDILRRVTADGYDPSQEKPDDPSKSKVNAVRLLEEWCRRAPNDPAWFSRFKVVPNAHNLKEIGMPGWISSYNGKPFLIKRPGVTGFIHQHPELSCLEFDISLHPFPYLAKQGICFMKESYFKKVLVSFGFVIEGKTEDELPECILGCMQLCYPDPAHAIQASDFFDGTANRSF